MSSTSKKPSVGLIVAVLIVLGLGYLVYLRSGEEEQDGDRDNIAAVAVAPIEERPIELRRIFSGALESHSKFVVAPKIGGRIEEIPVDISDTVTRGQTVVILDAAEYQQAFKQTEAELAVAQANLGEAKSALEIAVRENQRTATLRERGIASESEYDNVQANLLASQARLQVAEAQVARAEAALESARIRLSYTRITADWTGGDNTRIVAERYVDEGETVSANDPLLLIVELNPITAVIYVTERDYGLLSRGQPATFTTDAFPGEVFEGEIARISSVFRESSRQARVELALDNDKGKLKPGMFVRANIALRRVDQATVVPFAAITRRSGEQGVFLVDDADESVTWVPVDVGIRSGDWVQVLASDLSGRVVTLGQHLIDDGSPITIPEDTDTVTVAQ